jgi:hypothetical protein
MKRIKYAEATATDGGFFRRGFARLSRQQLETRVAASPLGMVVRDRVAKDAVKPRIDALSVADGVKLLGRLQESLLQKVFRIGARTDPLPDKSQERGPVLREHDKKLARERP